MKKEEQELRKFALKHLGLKGKKLEEYVKEMQMAWAHPEEIAAVDFMKEPKKVIKKKKK